MFDDLIKESDVKKKNRKKYEKSEEELLVSGEQPPFPKNWYPKKIIGKKGEYNNGRKKRSSK